MFENSPDVVNSDFTQVGIRSCLIEDVPAFLPEALMAVHTRSVVHEDRFRHEGDRLPVAPGYILNNVLELQELICHGQKRIESQINLTLTSACHFVVVHFHIHPGFYQGQHHLGADVMQRVHGRHREISFFVARFVAQVGVLLTAGIPVTLR